MDDALQELEALHQDTMVLNDMVAGLNVFMLALIVLLLCCFWYMNRSRKNRNI